MKKIISLLSLGFLLMAAQIEAAESKTDRSSKFNNPQSRDGNFLARRDDGTLAILQEAAQVYIFNDVDNTSHKQTVQEYLENQNNLQSLEELVEKLLEKSAAQMNFEKQQHFAAMQLAKEKHEKNLEELEEEIQARKGTWLLLNAAKKDLDTANIKLNKETNDRARERNAMSEKIKILQSNLEDKEKSNSNEAEEHIRKEGDLKKDVSQWFATTLVTSFSTLSFLFSTGYFLHKAMYALPAEHKLALSLQKTVLQHPEIVDAFNNGDDQAVEQLFELWMENQARTGLSAAINENKIKQMITELLLANSMVATA